MHSLLDLLSAVLVVVVVLVLLLQLLIRYDYTWLFRRKDVRDIEKIPGPKPIPYFGNMLIFNRPHEELVGEIVRMKEEYGNIYRLWVTGIPGVIIFDPDDVEVVLSSTVHITKCTLYELLMPWLCTGLLTSRGDKWHYRRKILTPTFHFKILEQYIQVANKESFIFADLLEKKVNEPYVAINDMARKCALDIICESAMGVSVHAQTGGNNEYVSAAKRITEVIVDRMTSPWYYRDIVYHMSLKGREQRKLLKILHGFTEKIIKSRREENRQRNNTFEPTVKRKRLAFLDLLLEISKDNFLTDEDIREEVDTFMLAGHDTTSVTLSWSLLLLGSHPEIQEKAADELREIFGDSTREASYDDLQKMVYLEMIIKETLRLYPAVAGLARKLGSDITLQGYRIPAGTEVGIVVAVIHRNPDIFPNPNVFNPDNFLPENTRNRHPFSYIPFSAGPRNCLGQRFAILESKVILSTLLRRFRVESLNTAEEIPAMYELIYRPKLDVRLKFFHREHPTYGIMEKSSINRCSGEDKQR